MVSEKRMFPQPVGAQPVTSIYGVFGKNVRPDRWHRTIRLHWQARLAISIRPALRAFNDSLRDGFTVVDAKNICPTPPPTQKTLRNNTCMPSKYVIVGIKTPTPT